MAATDHRLLVLLGETRARLAGLALLIIGVLCTWLCTNGAIHEQRPLGICGGAISSYPKAEPDPDTYTKVFAELGYALSPLQGERIFKGNCAACHRPDRNMTGPAIAGVSKRVPPPSEKWLNAFLLHEDSLQREKDSYVLHLQKQWPMAGWNHRLLDLRPDEAAQVIAWMTSY